MADSCKCINRAPAKVKSRELFMLFSLFVVQFLGFSFLLEGLIVIFRKNGLPLEKIGFVYLLGIFMVFKFLWAPFIDRVRLFKGVGHLKGWLVSIQFLLFGVLVLIGMCDVTEHITVIIALSMVVGFLAATHDVALDALVYRLVGESNRGVGNGIKIAGGMMGYMLGGGLALVLYGLLGWSGSFIFMCTLSVLAIGQLLFFKEGEHVSYGKEKIPYHRIILRFWSGRGKMRWLRLMTIYPMGVSLSYFLIGPIMVDVGWSVEKIGFIVNVLGAAVGAATAYICGRMINRLGRKRMLVVLAFMQSLCILMLLLPVFGYSGFWASLAIGSMLLIYAPSSTVLSTIMMDMCSEETPATDFAMQHSLTFLVGIISGIMGTILAGFFGYSLILISASLCSLAGVYLSVRFYSAADTSDETSAAGMMASESLNI
ncbi:major facilitator superfamily MFS_1 [Denitrovibrio acetiphilus DSM 12809]|uniref:Major facilitator superfamily MFS_1 n=1 Tax=Denitrovibrio acetiphilus (strain DSM 12809 / NBRC 114555 / N2460) TaxID=522772 RepID=D4H8L9_DENA2|nr:MFS transporter [Denitrovibrio acetiphilus]ADD68368.1 major facilitator superfamily MFS_1 [Denitrovibrio acetiphilus DSM 12809]